MNIISERIFKILTYSSKISMGATLLHGPWGCGKTYLWTKEIAPALEDEGLSPLHISLFGVSSINELKTKTVTALLKAKIKIRDNIDENLIVLGLKTGLGGLTKLVSKKLGFTLAPIQIDILSTLMPSETIICFDDIERCRIPIEETLGFINLLVEHKKCKVLIIANEDKIEEINKNNYTEYKEKLIWTSIKYDPDLETALNFFSNNIQDHKIKVKIAEQKEIILRIFSNHSNNVRVLLRTLRHLEEIYQKVDLPLLDSDVQFLCAIMIEDSKNGLKDMEFYNPYKMASQQYKTQKKESELTKEEKNAQDFYKRFQEQNPSARQSKAIFDFVKNGLLPVDDLINELTDEESKMTLDQKLLKEINEWFYKSEPEILKLIKKIEDFMRSPTPATAYCVLALSDFVVRKSEIINYNADQSFLENAKKRLEKQASYGDSTLDDRRWLERDLPIDRIDDLLDFFTTKKNAAQADHKMGIVQKWFESGNHKLGIFFLDNEPALLEEALDTKFIEKANSLKIINSTLFFTYYRMLIDALKAPAIQWPQEKKIEKLEYLKSNLLKLKTDPNLDKMGLMRIDDLIKMLS